MPAPPPAAAAVAQRMPQRVDADAGADAVAEHTLRMNSLQGYTALVLNADWQPLSFLPLAVWSWQDAIKASWQGRVDVVATYNIEVRSASESFKIPSVVVLRQYEQRDLKKPKFSKRLLMLRDGNRCQYCMDTFPPADLTCDHVIPRCYGGASTWENTVACCAACNARKASLLPTQLKAVGMKAPSPRAPTPHQLEAAAKGLCLHNLRRKPIHESWRLHLGDAWSDDAAAAEERGDDRLADSKTRKRLKR